MNAGPLSLFEATGVELEYMIVDAATLDVLPVCDRLVESVLGQPGSEVERDEFAWSNELVLHVVEVKTARPAASLDGLAAGFQGEVDEINRRLGELGARLMPTAMHPWMDPETETRIWPHEYGAVYAAYDRIFGCRGHGWSNLQSQHLNFPFIGEEEFGRLHAAIRALLPLLPALAASSPVADGRVTGHLDTRMRVYRTNSARIPSITGQVVPEPVFTPEAYRRDVLERLYRDIAPHDPEGVLQDEFLNARGAIARLGRGSIEIRVLDLQECPAADLAIARLVRSTLQALVSGRWEDPASLRALDTGSLASVLEAVETQGEQARVMDVGMTRALGWKGQGDPWAGDLWAHLAESLPASGEMAPQEARALRRILDEGPLARRILGATGTVPSRARLREVYGRLSECLAAGETFGA